MNVTISDAMLRQQQYIIDMLQEAHTIVALSLLTQPRKEGLAVKISVLRLSFAGREKKLYLSRCEPYDCVSYYLDRPHREGRGVQGGVRRGHVGQPPERSVNHSPLVASY